MIKKPTKREKSLFSKLTKQKLNDEEKKNLKIKSLKMHKRLRSRVPKDKLKNELLLRQIISYLTIEFEKV